MLPPPNSIIDQDKPLFHSLRIFAIKFHPLQPDIFLTGGWDEMVKAGKLPTLAVSFRADILSYRSGIYV